MELSVASWIRRKSWMLRLMACDGLSVISASSIVMR